MFIFIDSDILIDIYTYLQADKSMLPVSIYKILAAP